MASILLLSRYERVGPNGGGRFEALYSLQTNAPKLIAALKQALAMNVAGEERLLNKTAL
jgi:hypothetical protein